MLPSLPETLREGSAAPSLAGRPAGKAPVREMFQGCLLLGPPGSLRPVRLLLLTRGAFFRACAVVFCRGLGSPDSGSSPEGPEEAVSSLKSRFASAWLSPIQEHST